MLAAFRAQAAQRWNLPELDRQVRASQRRRRFHYTATTQGRIQAWDWQPFTDASQRYMRNHIGSTRSRQWRGFRESGAERTAS